MMKLDISMTSPRKPVGHGGGAPGGKVRTRPLGSVRMSNAMETVPKFPPLTSATKTPRIEPYEGIAGNKMAVPPPKLVHSEPQSRAESHAKSPEHVSTRHSHSTPPTRKQSARSVHTGCGCTHLVELQAREQDLREATTRERLLKEDILQLQKSVDELRQQIWEKEKMIEDLTQQFSRQEDNYRELYSGECTKHEATRQTLQSTTAELEEKTRECEEISRDFQQRLIDLQSRLESEVAAERAEKEREVAVRDEKFGKLKKQMAEALKGNSWERQQQLDELSKELQRVQEEAEMLKMRLKATGRGGGGAQAGSCGNCDSMKKQAASAQAAVRDRDKQIDELKVLCTRFERQLEQQESLLKQFAQSRGYKK